MSSFVDTGDSLGTYDLPEDWSWGEIKDAGAFRKNAIVDGPFGSNLKVSDYVEDGTVPVLTTRSINGELTDARYISKESSKN